jgi:methylated-DNA-[protein]-cysteine S-methyltransferase
VACTPYEAAGWGVGEVWVDGARLVWHELPQPSLGTRARARRTPALQGGGDRPPPSRSRLPSKHARIEDGTAPRTHELIHRFEAYFEGRRVDFDDVELELDGWTSFQRDVVDALRRVPYGEVVSYRDLARLAGYPRAQRAAGTFCARNRFGIVVPCHRVVASNGLGSYGSLGTAYKQRLLALEGVTL